MPARKTTEYQERCLVNLVQQSAKNITAATRDARAYAQRHFGLNLSKTTMFYILRRHQSREIDRQSQPGAENPPREKKQIQSSVLLQSAGKVGVGSNHKMITQRSVEKDDEKQKIWELQQAMKFPPLSSSSTDRLVGSSAYEEGGEEGEGILDGEQQNCDNMDFGDDSEGRVGESGEDYEVGAPSFYGGEQHGDHLMAAFENDYTEGGNFNDPVFDSKLKAAKLAYFEAQRELAVAHAKESRARMQALQRESRIKVELLTAQTEAERIRGKLLELDYEEKIRKSNHNSSHADANQLPLSAGEK